jgi:nitrogen fixation protein NifZ
MTETAETGAELGAETGAQTGAEADAEAAGAAPTDAAFAQPPREPKYDWGIAVRTEIDLLNDGGHPDAAPGALLVTKGTVGEIVRIGHVPTANNLPVYLVEFPGGRLIGCLEEEIVPVLGPRAQVPGRM